MRCEDGHTIPLALEKTASDCEWSPVEDMKEEEDKHKIIASVVSSPAVVSHHLEPSSYPGGDVIGSPVLSCGTAQSRYC